MSSRISAGVASLEGCAQVATCLLTAPAARRWYNRWGATAAEVACAMPGDELVPAPKMTSTRAITIDAPPPDVWAWLVQIGQGRGGFYSYDALENLARCDIHSADQIIPELQELGVGDMVRLAPAGAPCYRVVGLTAPSVLVLAGADPENGGAGSVGSDELASTWQWLLRAADSRGTRLVVRQRYSYPRRQSALWHLIEPIDFVMERRMLNGIKARAEAR